MNRRAVLSNLKTVLEAAVGITTVVRSYSEYDISQVGSANLPLIVIPEPGEDNDPELTSMRAMSTLDTTIKIYFVDWNDTVQSTFGTLVKNIRDQIGNNFTLNTAATTCRVMSISSVQGELPLWFFEIDLRTRYYLNQKNT